MILTGCVAFARHVGPTRVEAELLPQCWEQVTDYFVLWGWLILVSFFNKWQFKVFYRRIIWMLFLLIIHMLLCNMKMNSKA